MSEQYKNKTEQLRQAMESQLKANNHKEGWENCDAMWLIRRIADERAELKRAVEAYTQIFHLSSYETKRRILANILEEAADVANFAMMVADVCGALPLLAERPPENADGDEQGAEGA